MNYDTETARLDARQLYVTQRQAICRAADMHVPPAWEIEAAFDRAFPPYPTTTPVTFGWQVVSGGCMSYLYPDQSYDEALDLAIRLGTRATRVELRKAP